MEPLQGRADENHAHLAVSGGMPGRFLSDLMDLQTDVYSSLTISTWMCWKSLACGLQSAIVMKCCLGEAIEMIAIRHSESFEIHLTEKGSNGCMAI